MNLYDLNSDKITMNIDGQDIEMKPAICYGKVYNKWLVSKCGKVWSNMYNSLLKGGRAYYYTKSGKTKKLHFIKHTITMNEADWWGDGSGSLHHTGYVWEREIKEHKLIIDTWAPLYDNPPEGIVWEEWKIVRDMPSVFNHISKTVIIDHIDDNPANNHLDNLRRTTSWDNQVTRKAKGI